jgi:hypothetical protein
MATSQNGWPVVTSKDQYHFYPVPGDTSKKPGTVSLRKGDVATVMLELLGDLQQIEAAVWPGIWGGYVRPIRGKSSGYSNHASYTAIDWNAPQHGRQMHDRYLGWTDAQVAKIHHLLATKYAGLIRWGADYNKSNDPNGTPFDPMHFEIIGTPAEIRALARQLVANAPQPQPGKGEDKMMVLVKTQGKPARFVSSDMTWLTWIQDEDQLSRVTGEMERRGLNTNVTDAKPGTIAAGKYGQLVPGSPKPPADSF